LSYREESRRDWGIDSANAMNLDRIKAGAILRIADATEAMAKNYLALQEERDRYKRWYEERQRRVLHLERSNAALRGVITRMKKTP
jgi:hypothetical protein